MILTPLASHSPGAVREALVRRGMDGVRADAAARGLAPVVLLFDDLTPAERDALAGAAAPRGLACLTGDGWALLAGGAAQIAGLTRSQGLPERLTGELGQVLRGVVERPAAWDMARGTISLERPVVVGIVNVTPDSFSDGGRFLAADAALAHIERLLAEGADMLDVGAESTRPGRPTPVAEDVEWARLAPVLAEAVRRFPQIPFSVDTVKSGVARRALDAGAWAINDVSALRLDPCIAEVCAEHGAGLVLMHSRGSLTDMAGYDHAEYHDVTTDVIHELRDAVRVAEDRGMARARLVLDPGLGFAKRPEQTLAVLDGLPALAALGFPVMIGPSRKRFLGELTGADVAQRDPATAAVSAAAYLLGATLFRVHAVGPVREALTVAHGVRAR